MNKNKNILVYLIFGVLTTAVNWIVYLPLYNALGISATLSNAVAWVFAVAFAFLTNKPIVFGSHDWSRQVVIPELTKFVGCRIGTGLMETGILLLTVDLLGWNGNLWKAFASVLVIILNYVGSKLLVFKNR